MGSHFLAYVTKVCDFHLDSTTSDSSCTFLQRVSGCLEGCCYIRKTIWQENEANPQWAGREKRSQFKIHGRKLSPANWKWYPVQSNLSVSTDKETPGPHLWRRLCQSTRLRFSVIPPPKKLLDNKCGKKTLKASQWLSRYTLFESLVLPGFISLKLCHIITKN